MTMTITEIDHEMTTEMTIGKKIIWGPKIRNIDIDIEIITATHMKIGIETIIKMITKTDSEKSIEKTSMKTHTKMIIKTGIKTIIETGMKIGMRTIIKIGIKTGTKIDIETSAEITIGMIALTEVGLENTSLT